MENKYGESARRQAQAEMKKDAVCELVSQTPPGSQTAPVCPTGQVGTSGSKSGNPYSITRHGLQFSSTPRPEV